MVVPRSEVEHEGREDAEGGDQGTWERIVDRTHSGDRYPADTGSVPAMEIINSWNATSLDDTFDRVT